LDAAQADVERDEAGEDDQEDVEDGFGTGARFARRVEEFLAGFGALQQAAAGFIGDLVEGMEVGAEAQVLVGVGDDEAAVHLFFAIIADSGGVDLVVAFAPEVEGSLVASRSDLFEGDIADAVFGAGDFDADFEEAAFRVEVFEQNDAAVAGVVGIEAQAAFARDARNRDEGLLDEGDGLIPTEPVAAPAGREVGGEGGGFADAEIADGEYGVELLLVRAAQDDAAAGRVILGGGEDVAVEFRHGVDAFEQGAVIEFDFREEALVLNHTLLKGLGLFDEDGGKPFGVFRVVEATAGTEPAAPEDDTQADAPLDPEEWLEEYRERLTECADGTAVTELNAEVAPVLEQYPDEVQQRAAKLSLEYVKALSTEAA